MTRSPDSENQSPDPGDQPTSTAHPMRRFLVRASWVVAGLVLAGGVGAVGFARWFVDHRLSPLISQQLTGTVNRPVVLGEVEGFSLSSLRFGETTLPATESDRDTVTVESIAVGFNLLELLRDRTITLNLTLVHPEVFLDQTEDGAWLSLTLTEKEKGPITVNMGTIRVENATLVMQPFPWEQLETGTSSALDTSTAVATAEPSAAAPVTVTLNSLNATAQFRNENRWIAFEVNGQPQNQGRLNLQGEADLDDNALNLLVRSTDLLAADLAPLVRSPLTVQAGEFDTHLNVALDLQNLLDVQVNGTVTLRSLASQIAGVPNPITDVAGTLRFVGQRVSLEDLSGRYGELVAQVGGSVDLDQGFALSVLVPSVTVDQVTQTLEVASPIAAEGEFRANLQITGAFDQPRITGLINNISPVQVDQVAIADIGTRFALTPTEVQISEFRIVPQMGGVIQGQGEVILGSDGGLVFDIQAQDLPADAIAQTYGATLPASMTVGAVNATVQVFGPLATPDDIRAIVDWDALQGSYPAQGRILYGDRLVQLINTQVEVLGGTVVAEAEAGLDDRTWRAFFEATDVPLAQFSNYLSGVLTAELGMAGSLDDLRPQAIEAEGVAFFSQGIYLLDRPLGTRFSWLGDRLKIDRATAPGFEADGVILAQLEGDNPGIAGIDLNVELLDFDLAAVQPFLPPAIQAQLLVAGQANFAGQISGTPTDPAVVGDVWLDDFAINNLAFEPLLAGSVDFALSRGVNLEMRGDQDEIALNLDRQFLPNAFTVQIGDARVAGERQGDRLEGVLESFDLARLNLAPAAEQGLGIIQGVTNAEFSVNLADLNHPTVQVDVAIAHPGIGYIRADQFRGRLLYSEGIAALNDAELSLGSSHYRLDGRFDPTADPEMQAEIIVDEGNAQDLLTALQIFDVRDFSRGLRPPNYAEGSDVQPYPIDLAGESLITQLRRLSEISVLQDQQAIAESDALIPPLNTAQGRFTGQIDLAFSTQTGPSLDFNLAGNDWSWGDYNVDTVTVIGDYQGGILALLPLRLEVDDAFLNITGQIGGTDQSAQLIARNFPIAALRDLVNLPLNIEGNLNANAILSGSVENPQATGGIELVEGSLNETPIESAGVRLSYADARLNFLGTMTAAPTEGETSSPVRLVGSVPIALPFMTVQPDSDEIQLNVDVSDDGIALMNLFTNGVVTWEGGSGDVSLDVQGTLSNLQALGTITLEDATFAAQALPDPITHVNGRILFDRDRIRVEELHGEFGDGQIAAQGQLPIVIPFSIPMVATAVTADMPPDQATAPTLADEFPLSPDGPLTIALDGLEVELNKGLYNGNVDGRLLIQGTALAPQIGGRIALSNGLVSLQTHETPVATDTSLGAETDTNRALSPPELNHLDVFLGNELRIVRSQPDIFFAATGNLLINGPFDDLRPRGTVQLRRGYVNLVTTQFNLMSPNPDFSQTATFSPENGLDPVLDVRLMALVPEVTRPPTITSASAFTSSEIADPTRTASDFGSVQTVRIFATVEGPASQLFGELELSSSPSRSQTEIVGLLGGGTLSALEQGDGTLAIANLAGSALLGNLQNLIGNALGLSEFRLFPTQVTSETSESSTLGLAAEVGIDVTQNLSASILQVLTADEPTQFNLRYRINDQLSVRSGMMLNGESRVILEYETRF